MQWVRRMRYLPGLGLGAALLIVGLTVWAGTAFDGPSDRAQADLATSTPSTGIQAGVSTVDDRPDFCGA
jgi:hypothetical protein